MLVELKRRKVFRVGGAYLVIAWKDLHVAGRTYSFYYKGRNEDLRSIGKALGEAHILEGSVRKQGDQVRITARLIQSAGPPDLGRKAANGDYVCA